MTNPTPDNLPPQPGFIDDIGPLRIGDPFEVPMLIRIDVFFDSRISNTAKTLFANVAARLHIDEFTPPRSTRKRPSRDEALTVEQGVLARLRNRHGWRPMYTPKEMPQGGCTGAFPLSKVTADEMWKEANKR